jgi:hypothetical protein
LTENDWKRRVTDTAKLFNWRWAHFRPARTAKGWRTAVEGHKGFPDLVLVRPPRVIFAELKVNTRPTFEQAQWLDDLSEVSGVEVYLWTPDNWNHVFTTLAKDSSPTPRQTLQPNVVLGVTAHGREPTGIRRSMGSRQLSRP